MCVRPRYLAVLVGAVLLVPAVAVSGDKVAAKAPAARGNAYSKTTEQLLVRAEEQIADEQWIQARASLRKALVFDPDNTSVKTALQFVEEECRKRSDEMLAQAWTYREDKSNLPMARWACQQSMAFANDEKAAAHVECRSFLSGLAIQDAYSAWADDRLRDARDILRKLDDRTPEADVLLADLERECAKIADGYFREAREHHFANDAWGACRKCRLGLSFAVPASKEDDVKWCVRRVRTCRPPRDTFWE